ncbi:Neuromedin-B, partial [Varanus komodoensis]
QSLKGGKDEEGASSQPLSPDLLEPENQRDQVRSRCTINIYASFGHTGNTSSMCPAPRGTTKTESVRDAFISNMHSLGRVEDQLKLLSVITAKSIEKVLVVLLEKQLVKQNRENNARLSRSLNVCLFMIVLANFTQGKENQSGSVNVRHFFRKGCTWPHEECGTTKTHSMFGTVTTKCCNDRDYCNAE